MTIDEEIARAELTARTLAEVFEAAAAGGSEVARTNARTAALYIQIAEKKSELVPADIVERITTQHARMGELVEARVLEAVRRGADAQAAVDQLVRAYDTISEQDRAELKSFALRGWKQCVDNLQRMLHDVPSVTSAELASFEMGDSWNQARK